MDFAQECQYVKSSDFAAANYTNFTIAPVLALRPAGMRAGAKTSIRLIVISHNWSKDYLDRFDGSGTGFSPLEVRRLMAHLRKHRQAPQSPPDQCG